MIHTQKVVEPQRRVYNMTNTPYTSGITEERTLPYPDFKDVPGVSKDASLLKFNKQEGTIDDRGYGIIYHATFRNLPVALKIFKTSNNNALHCFKIEQQIVTKAGALLSPQPVRVFCPHEGYIHPDFPKSYMIMYEYGGESIETMIQNINRQEDSMSRRSGSCGRNGMKPTTNNSSALPASEHQRLAYSPSCTNIRTTKTPIVLSPSRRLVTANNSNSQNQFISRLSPTGTDSSDCSNSSISETIDIENEVTENSKQDDSTQILHDADCICKDSAPHSPRSLDHCDGSCLAPRKQLWNQELLAQSLYSLILVSHLCGILHPDVHPRSFLYQYDEQSKRHVFKLCNFARSAGSNNPSLNFALPYQELHDPRFRSQANLFTLGSTLFWILTGGKSIPKTVQSTGQLPSVFPKHSVIHKNVWMVIRALWDRQATHATIIEAFEDSNIDWRVPAAMLGPNHRLSSKTARDAELELEMIFKALQYEVSMIGKDQYSPPPEVNFYFQLLSNHGMVDHEVTSTRTERRLYETIKRLLYYVALRLCNLQSFVPVLRDLSSHFSSSTVLGPYIDILLRLHQRIVEEKMTESHHQ